MTLRPDPNTRLAADTTSVHVILTDDSSPAFNIRQQPNDTFRFLIHHEETSVSFTIPAGHKDALIIGFRKLADTLEALNV